LTRLFSVKRILLNPSGNTLTITANILRWY
jgi:hypothetical protein